VELEISKFVDRLIIASSSPRAADDNHPIRRVVNSLEPFKFWLAPTISLDRLKLEWSNFVHRQAMTSPSK